MTYANGTNAGHSGMVFPQGSGTAIIRHTDLPESPRLLPAEFPLFFILFLKCYKQVAVNAVAFVKEDFEIEFVRAVFHCDGDLICTCLGKPDTAEVFFDAGEGEITAARNEPLGFSFCP